MALILSLVFIGIPLVSGLKPYVVMSGSMEPEIPTGAIAYIDARDTEFGIGDVITFQLGSDEDPVIVTHRIVGETPDGLLVTKGDANDSEDAKAIDKSDVLGVFRFAVPKAGYAYSAVRPALPVVLIWIVALNIIAAVLPSGKKGPDEDSAEANTR